MPTCPSLQSFWTDVLIEFAAFRGVRLSTVLKSWVAGNQEFCETIQARQTRRSVAQALLGEINAISKRIEFEYLKKLCIELTMMKTEGRYPSHHLRGQKNLATVFGSLGANIGCLPSDLVSELVSWHISLAIYQERESELYELTSHRSTELMEYAIELAELQHAGYSDLVRTARPLTMQLAAF